MSIPYDYPLKEEDELVYHATGGFGTRDVRVKVTGFRRRFVITKGIEDGVRRDVPRSRLSLG